MTYTREQACADLDEQYARIPSMLNCNGQCWHTCRNISATRLENERVAEVGHPLARRIPDAEEDKRKRHGEEMPNRCTNLGPFGNCTVYADRPYVCRLWGTADLPALRMRRCPMGCEPERWLSLEEARDIGIAISEISDRFYRENP